MFLGVGRNDKCPCGSGKKYKKCCINKKNDTPQSIKESYYKKFKIIIKNKEQIEGIRKAGKLVMETHKLVEEFLEAGITTNQINELVHNYTMKNKAIPAPLNYRGFTKSACTSVNEVICHGIPSEYALVDGDIINVDITSILDGYFADASYTYFIGAPNDDAKKIVHVAKQSLKAGLSCVAPGLRLGDVGHAIQSYAEAQGCSVVREFVGHGIGVEFHEPPNVMHFGKKGTQVMLVPGMVFTVEPMINLGKKALHILDDKWTAVTNDGALSAQFEQTIVVTENGYESLTPFPL
jgi:methionyl aminopeptidase